MRCFVLGLLLFCCGCAGRTEKNGPAVIYSMNDSEEGQSFFQDDSLAGKDTRVSKGLTSGEEVWGIRLRVADVTPTGLMLICEQSGGNPTGELQIVRKYGAVFVIGIGAPLSDGIPHDGRAADYDDWSTPNEEGYVGLNGDLLLWNPVLNSAFEVSSMGIRVDEAALERQLKMHGQEAKRSLYFHQKLLSGALPCTIGGGIGQSRLCMYLLRKAHIGEIQSSIWPESMRKECAEAGIVLA